MIIDTKWFYSEVITNPVELCKYKMCKGFIEDDVMNNARIIIKKLIYSNQAMMVDKYNGLILLIVLLVIH